MEPIITIATSVALGAAAATGNAVVNAVVKDAYEKLKSMMGRDHPDLELEHLEKEQEPKLIRDRVEVCLLADERGPKADLLSAALDTIRAIERHAPEVAAAVGVDLKDFVAANLRLEDISASGTGVRVERARVVGDIEIRGVRAGVGSSNPPDED